MTGTPDADATDATAVDRPPREPGSSPSLHNVSTPDEALAADEAVRARLFVLFLLPLVAIAAVAFAFVDADPVATRVLYVGLGVGFAGFSLIAWQLRDVSAYRPRHNTMFGLLSVGVIGCAYYYFGVFSAVLLLVPFGAFIFSVGQSLRSALTITVAATASHAVLALLTIFGAVEDHSLFGPRGLGQGPQLVVLGLVHAIFWATFAMARNLRRQQLASISQLDRTARALAQRDALLAEARQSLKRALRVGEPGPYSDHVFGTFRVGVLMGRGAMGEVYEATRETSGERCAIKLLHPHAMANPGHFQRFLREAQTAATIDSPHVARVLEIGDPAKQLPYMAMERLSGVDLAEYLQERERLPLSEVLELVAQTGAGLQAAHAAGIVHRDMKPHNVFRHEVDGEVTWKILDFGVSKLADGGGTLTQGHIVGTPSYMAPEQARGEEVDYRADWYALAAIAYRALTGRPPFTGGDVHGLLRKVVDDMPPRPSEIAGLDPAFDDVFTVALAKEPAARFASAAELHDALAAAGRGHTWRRSAGASSS